MTIARRAQINSATNIVENVVMTDSTFAIPGYIFVASDSAGTGDVYDPAHGTFSPPAPPTPQIVPTIKKLQFRDALASVLTKEGADALITGSPEILSVYAGATDMDYSDVFVTTDEGEPGYALKMLAAGAVTQAQVDAFEAAWPRA
jgi:hypothetical protein